MFTMPIFFFGNGDKTVVTSNSGSVFINTSFGRVTPIDDRYEISTLFMADGYTDIVQVKRAAPIPGYSIEESQHIRSEKLLLYSKVNTKNLFLFTSRSESEIISGLEKLGLSYEHLHLVSLRKLYWMCLCLSITARAFAFKIIVSWFWSVITNKKPSPAHRPSTGLAAVLMSHFDTDASRSFCLSGILSESSYYGQGRDEVNFKNVHAAVDAFLLDCLACHRKVEMVTTNAKHIN
jgi:hypothetical protein